MMMMMMMMNKGNKEGSNKIYAGKYMMTWVMGEDTEPQLISNIPCSEGKPRPGWTHQ